MDVKRQNVMKKYILIFGVLFFFINTVKAQDHLVCLELDFEDDCEEERFRDSCRSPLYSTLR